MRERVLLDHESKDKPFAYIQICLDQLLVKLELKREEVHFDQEACTIALLPNLQLPTEKSYFLHSFVDSINPELAIHRIGWADGVQ